MEWELQRLLLEETAWTNAAPCPFWVKVMKGHGMKGTAGAAASRAGGEAICARARCGDFGTRRGVEGGEKLARRRMGPIIASCPNAIC